MSALDAITTRRLTREDLPRAVDILANEGWSFGENELARLLDVGGGVALDMEGTLQGLLTHTVYPAKDPYPAVAWIGNVVVAETLRGRGAGARLVETALANLDDAKVESVRLYSVFAAITLYRRMGFRDGYKVTSLHGDTDAWAACATGAPRNTRALTLDDAPDIAAFDARFFGADRSRLITTLLASESVRGHVVEDMGGIRAFAFAKCDARGGGEIGPFVTRPRDEKAAASAFDAVMNDFKQGIVEIASPDANARHRALIEGRGFAPAFSALAMTRGRLIDERIEGIVGVGGLEKG